MIRPLFSPENTSTSQRNSPQGTWWRTFSMTEPSRSCMSASASRTGIAYSSSSRRTAAGRDLIVSVAVRSSLMRTRIDTFPSDARYACRMRVCSLASSCQPFPRTRNLRSISKLMQAPQLELRRGTPKSVGGERRSLHESLRNSDDVLHCDRQMTALPFWLGIKRKMQRQGAAGAIAAQARELRIFTEASARFPLRQASPYDHPGVSHLKRTFALTLRSCAWST